MSIFLTVSHRNECSSTVRGFSRGWSVPKQMSNHFLPLIAASLIFFPCHNSCAQPGLFLAREPEISAPMTEKAKKQRDMDVPGCYQIRSLRAGQPVQYALTMCELGTARRCLNISQQPHHFNFDFGAQFLPYLILVEWM